MVITATTTAVETASCIFQHFGRFGTPEAIHTDRGTVFHNEVVEELLRMTGVEQSLTTAYSSEENGIVENGQNLQTWLMESGSLRIFITYGLSIMIQRGQCPW